MDCAGWPGCSLPAARHTPGPTWCAACCSPHALPPCCPAFCWPCTLLANYCSHLAPTCQHRPRFAQSAHSFAGFLQRAEKGGAAEGSGVSTSAGERGCTLVGTVCIWHRRLISPTQGHSINGTQGHSINGTQGHSSMQPSLLQPRWAWPLERPALEQHSPAHPAKQHIPSPPTRPHRAARWCCSPAPQWLRLCPAPAA